MRLDSRDFQNTAKLLKNRLNVNAFLKTREDVYGTVYVALKFWLDFELLFELNREIST